MRSDAYLRMYAHEEHQAPTAGWQRLLWMAAELVKRSQKERNTWRERREKAKDETQPYLPNLVIEQTPAQPTYDTHGQDDALDFGMFAAIDGTEEHQQLVNLPTDDNQEGGD